MRRFPENEQWSPSANFRACPHNFSARSSLEKCKWERWVREQYLLTHQTKANCFWRDRLEETMDTWVWLCCYFFSERLFPLNWNDWHTLEGREEGKASNCPGTKHCSLGPHSKRLPQFILHSSTSCIRFLLHTKHFLVVFNCSIYCSAEH